MDFHASAAPFSRKSVGIENVRRSVTYHPTVWGDYFLDYDSNLTDTLPHEEQKHQSLKEKVKQLLLDTPHDSLHILDLIEAIQCLGVGYHFVTEIEKSLKYAYDTYIESCGKQNNDFCTIALRFRLLRQQGYYVSCDVFNKFKDHKGNFDESLISNVQGLLSLYEATQLRVHGEEILEEALKFSTTQLNSLLLNVCNSLSTQIKEALDIPIRKTVPRHGAKKFISICQEDESHNEKLLNFAKLDFNLLQKMHQKELSEVTTWWKALEIENKLPFARDRLVECYFWALATYFEPQYSIGRKMLTKVTTMISIADDIFDVYGTLDDLTLFTDAIERWDFSVIDQLPTYMQHFYKAILDVYVEIEEEMGKIEKSYLAHYVIEEKKRLIRSYFQEAKCVYSGYIPTLEEYLKVGKPSSTCLLLSAVALAGIGEVVTKEAFEWVASDPLILQGSEIIGRIMNDMTGFGFEQKITAVECYMNQNKGATKEEAFAELQELVTDAWKDINEECLHPTVVPTPKTLLLEIVDNYARATHLNYRNIDDYTNSEVNAKDVITCVLVEPMTTP
ncbi:(-)-germacrene D synthase [Olea europaea subsp. europaea]|uniref:(-)-germacrene D synthase n=1 Tax=Olea europaea subsp. europaea TaxID=158383 RepID=A0A8S0U2A9_OLEEU|nr:(-)-germacrene D synthase [Olea europaea subsp. europaea]